ncbi:MAG: ABC transporter permease [Cellulomonadaceae bacterium]|jgi:ABC-2 type transport system permease protein|nr:ABC transporter permease [Cellulomonadaceae bacterium]
MTTSTLTPSATAPLTTAPLTTAASSPLARIGTATRQLGLVLQWNVNRMRSWLPLTIVVQVMMTVLTVLGYGMLIGTPTPQAAVFLATGAVTVQMLMMGLVMVPQAVGQSKTEGSLAWMRTLPVPRLVFFLADMLTYALLALPGTVLALVVGAWHYGISLSVSVWALPAALLVALISTSVGYALAMLLPPLVAGLISQVLVFVVLMFSPVSFPAANLPGWLAVVHEWLPIASMADLMRATLASDTFTMSLRAGLVLAAWTVLAVIGAIRVLSRRV